MFGVDAVRHPLAIPTVAIDLHAARASRDCHRFATQPSFAFAQPVNPTHQESAWHIPPPGDLRHQLRFAPHF
ncbi:hypothetical protein [Bradyrhizobium sp. dw_411]|uniref:hypothetical protein n=1 Tax=Bradyrhizobium sp. dw_411 TaxID=2720082 RepID=UPI001BCCED6E|nr:hypothetical protein [Bradyrhizobium sp. dw_411]